MKTASLTFFLILTFTFSFATERAIIANVVFENLTDKELTSGEFYITETNEKIHISNTESFQITLPEKGRYQFGFSTQDFDAYTFYPARITKSKNTITIRLEEKMLSNTSNTTFSFPLNLDNNLTDEEIEQRIEAGTLNFIIHGIDASIPNEYVKFKEKYGVGVTKENCVVDPMSFKKAVENNQMIFDYLNKKYGTDWLNELPSKPLGIK